MTPNTSDEATASGSERGDGMAGWENVSSAHNLVLQVDRTLAHGEALRSFRFWLFGWKKLSAQSCLKLWSIGRAPLGAMRVEPQAQKGESSLIGDKLVMVGNKGDVICLGSLKRIELLSLLWQFREMLPYNTGCDTGDFKVGLVGVAGA